MPRAKTLRQIQQAAAQYSQQVQGNRHLREEVKQANPYQLIKMLYAALESHLDAGLSALERGDTVSATRCLDKAHSSINYLRACLSPEFYPELYETLDALYDYMGQRLVTARLKHEVAAVQEVQELLRPLQEAWVEVETTADELYKDFVPADYDSLSESG
ncbi:flagellar export chaperone FliS [Terasakiispira papahanaumokuakeensis]|uniref:Flagellar export chaperone FliS n=1 Tax=Terasakiispira papahanaumokuakeensis TaxID=197479 RepID=A0A1E2VB78_9GAMM|nr:flagellar export chaperone FliS [Terasakiispira papahanaumokuakeensis]ODC04173.1 flagellar export chaperone FliS [Terasakiispira papahanaumokuakeensis]